MIRPRTTWLLPLLLACACGGATDPPAGTSSASATPIGAPCVFAIEDDPTFAGFDASEVNVQAQAGYVSGDPVCLANHFRGRVSCPYGQDPAAGTCTTPAGAAVHPSVGTSVEPQCADRTADKTVYTSCRCANESGRTDDGGHYCVCPGELACIPMVMSVEREDPSVALAGSYCVKKGTAYTPSACITSCAPGVVACP